MASITWTGGSGSWNTASDWSGGVVPTEVDTVTISIPLITVTINGTTPCAAYSLTTTSSTLSVAGGTLTTIASATFDGAYLESSGLYMAGGTGAVFADGITMTGGTIETLAGAALNISGGGSLGGTLTGTGQLDITGGSTYIQAGFACSLSSIVVSAGLGFDTNFTTKSNFTETSTGTVDLFGHKLTIAGNSVIDGTIGNGILTDSGTLTLGTPGQTQFLDNGLTLDVSGTVIQSGNVDQGSADAGAKIVISKTGQYLINSNWSITDPLPSSVSTITNAGILAKTGGGKVSTIATSLTNTGTIEADTGTLLLSGLVNSISGVVSGAGTLALAGAQTTFGKKLSLKVACLDQQSGLLVMNKSLGFSGEWDMTGGVLNLNSAGETLTLSGRSDFDGGTITGYGGTVLISGSSQLGGNLVVGGPNTLTISGMVDQTGNISFGPGSNPEAQILKGAMWSIEGDSTLGGPYGLIDNAGTFIDPNGSATAIVGAQFVSTGTVTVNASTLQFQSTTMLGGTITGSGTLDLNGTSVLEGGLGISVAALTLDSATLYLGESLSYGNIFSQFGGSTLDLGGETLTLAGATSLESGTLTDIGTMAVTGSAVLANYNTVYSINDEAVLSVSGHAEQAGQVELNGGTLSILAGGTYTFDDDVSIFGTGLISLAGTLAVANTGTSTIGATLNETAGTLIDNAQTLTLSSGGTLDAAISGTGSLALGGGTFTLGSALTASVATIDLRIGVTTDLAANIGYSGTFFDEGIANLDGDTLSLTGSAVLNGATINGAGTLSAGGTTTLSNVIIQDGGTLKLTGMAEQGPGNTFVNSGTLAISSTGTLSLDANQSIFGGGALNVAGALISGGDGNGVLNVSIVDTGVIAANLGTLDIGGGVTGSGAFSIGANATMIFSNTSTITSATTVGFAGTNADLIIQNPILAGGASTFGAVLSDFAAGDAIEILNINSTTATGTLSANGLQYVVTDSNSDTLTLTFTTKQTQGSIYLGTTAGTTTVFHH
jgi:hypothetical protein